MGKSKGSKRSLLVEPGRSCNISYALALAGGTVTWLAAESGQSTHRVG